jgi:toxin ParE1/3/4
MQFTMVVSPDVKQEISDAFNWYRERNVKAAEGFRSEVLAALDLIVKDPARWALQDESVRRYVLKHYPYSVYFSILEVQVRILAVGHHRRRAGYWVGRKF